MPYKIVVHQTCKKVSFKHHVLFLFLSCEREKEPKMRRRIATLFGQANAFVTWRHKFAFANRIILHYINKSGLMGSFAACDERQLTCKQVASLWFCG